MGWLHSPAYDLSSDLELSVPASQNQYVVVFPVTDISLKFLNINFVLFLTLKDNHRRTAVIPVD